MFGSDIEPLLPPTDIPMENSFANRLPAQGANTSAPCLLRSPQRN
jgi:hypothetical protein